MTTYQDIVDYLNEHYCLGGEYTVIEHGDYDTITDGDVTNDIYNDCYKSPLYIDAKLSRLLADLLDTPVNQRNKSEIKHTIKPVTKESIDTANLTSADEIIAGINNFITKEFKICPNRTLFITTNYNKDDLLKILSLFKDFDITLDAVPNSYPGYIY